jgi:hypothetical protein
MLAFEFCLFLYCGHPTARATHFAPVILVDSPTTHADLIVLPVNITMGPGELMTTKYFEESLEEFICHDCLVTGGDGVVNYSSRPKFARAGENQGFSVSL